MVQTNPADALHDAETTTMSAAVPTSADIRTGMTVALTTAKQSNGTGPAPAQRAAKGGHTLLNVNLCRLHPCRIQHLIAASLKPPSEDTVPARLSFDHSQCSLPPLELGEEDARSLPSVGVPIQAATPSMAGPIPLHSTSASALNLMADHTKIIFNLACEGLHLNGAGH